MMNKLRRVVENFGHRVRLDIIPLWAAEALVSRVQKVFRQHEIQCVIDIGANEGQYCGLFHKRVVYSGIILSFEPITSLYQALKVRAEDKDSGWHIFPYALGSTVDKAVINIAKNSVFISLRQLDAKQCDLFASQKQVVEQQTIQVHRLGNMWPQTCIASWRKKLYLKSDTHGYDLEVVRGAGFRLGHFAFLQCELAALKLIGSRQFI